MPVALATSRRRARQRRKGKLPGATLATGAVVAHPSLVGYVGGYYQFENNWKISGRLGVQRFGGLRILDVTLAEPFTQPVVRLDLDRVDDEGNRLFGVTGEIVWATKPVYLLTLRTPVYLAGN